MSVKDPITGPAARPDRLHYAVGALLGADDFVDEQAYHRGRLARALGYLGGTGTVAGLRVEVRPPSPGDPRAAEDGEQVRVRPGVAVDPHGRLVELAEPACTRLNRWLSSVPAAVRQTGYVTVADAVARGHLASEGDWAAAGLFVVDVFLRFHPCERGFTPSFAQGPYAALDAVSPARVRDGAELSLVLRQETPAPVPDDPWPVPADPALRERALQDAVLDGWREGTEHFDARGARRLAEHAEGQDGSEVLLARLLVPARPRPAGGGTEYVRAATGSVTLDNHLRRFVYPSGALARWIDG